tara:strand:+ start:306 stop:479 length:174 start_codon:yes stop_codon:yes gene_type:complete
MDNINNKIELIHSAIKEGWKIKIKNNKFILIKHNKSFHKLPEFLIKYNKSKTKKIMN